MFVGQRKKEKTSLIQPLKVLVRMYAFAAYTYAFERRLGDLH